MNSEPRPLVVSGPSGSGKSTLLNRLFAEFPETFGFSVSHTTRPSRPGEEDGKQYHFVDRENFQKMVDEGKFIEHAEFGGNLYGTSVEAIKKVAEATKIAVLDVDMQGVKSVKTTDLNARFVFIKPPSVEVLEQRLRARGTETEQAIKDRLALATAELEYAAQPGSHDLVIVNDSLDEAYNQLKEYVVSITGALPAATVDQDKSAAADQPPPTKPEGLAIPDAQPGASASPSSASPAAAAASPAPTDASKSGKKGQDKKEKEAAEKAKKEKAKEEKAANKAKEKEEKAKKSKGGAKGKGGPASPTADEAGAAAAAAPAASAAAKKSKTCTIL